MTLQGCLRQELSFRARHGHACMFQFDRGLWLWNGGPSICVRTSLPYVPESYGVQGLVLFFHCLLKYNQKDLL